MPVHFETFSESASIDSKLWNELARPASPLMEWEYFTALERSGSASPERGYFPVHVLALMDETPVALAPMYERDRSWVEFGDGGLIQFLSDLARIPYQRGLVGTLPFTPVPAYQFLIRPDLDASKWTGLLLDYVDYLCETRSLYTSRLYFFSPGAPEIHRLLRAKGYLTFKTGYSLWFNRGFKTFDDFLATFKSSRRTKIKREMRTIENLGIQMDMVPGTQAPAKMFKTMHELYLRTWRKHMGWEIPPFLKDAFFEHLEGNFRHRVSFCTAHQEEREKAMALFYHKDDTLYGRYWGCFDEVPFLHFALCYYYPIDHAIRNGFRVMDPGFGGEHKLIRGFEVVPVFHYIKFHGEKESQIARNILRKVQVQRDILS